VAINQTNKTKRFFAF